MRLFRWLFRSRTKPLPRGNDAARGVLAAASVGYITSDYARLATSESVRAMTKDAWLASSDTLAMLCFLHGRGSGRKFRLFATACARDLLAQTPNQDEETHHPDSGWATAISEAEAFADGGDPPRNRGGWQVACRVGDAISDEDVAHSALGFDADVGLWTTPIEDIVPRMTARYRTHPAVYLRDVFGAVFHEGAPDPEWRTATVLSLAETAYRERAMPDGHLDPLLLTVLSDALEEAGGADTALLEHLRSPDPHVRGCWALDLVLAKR